MTRVRTFDYETARALRRSGATFAEVGALCGVSPSRIMQVCHPDFEQQERDRSAQTQAAFQTTCHYCGGLAVYNPYQADRRHAVPRCRACFLKQRRATPSPNVRGDTLRCAECQQWLPDEHFPRRVKASKRRGRHSWCRDCCTLRRRVLRERAKRPCTRCGALRGGAGDGNKSGLCRTCWQDTRSYLSAA